MYAQGFGPLAFVFDQTVQCAAKANNILDPEPLKLIQASVLGLSTAIKVVVDLAEIGDALNGDFSAEGHLRRRTLNLVSIGAADSASGQEQREESRKHAVTHIQVRCRICCVG